MAVDEAVSAAVAAFPEYRARSREEIARFLDAIGEGILGLGDVLLETCAAETGLPRARLEGERARTVGQLGLFARVVGEGSWVRARIDRALPDRKPAPRPDIRSMLVPLGPVAVFGSSNFPFAFSTAGGDTASALAAGCPVIVKAHSGHPGTSDLVAGVVSAAVKSAGLPAGVFSHVHCDHAGGLALVRAAGVKAAGFTGSLAAGRALFDAAASRPDPIPLFAEMGSVNPVVVLPSALAGGAAGLAESLCGSVTLGVGQFCTNPGLVFVLEGPGTDAFLAALAGRIAATPPAAMLTGAILAAYVAGVERMAAVPGVTVAGRAATAPDRPRREGAAVVMAVSGAVFLATPVLREEIFGPSTLVVRCADNDELEAGIAALPGQLTATVHGTEPDVASRPGLVSLLRDRSGRLLFGGVPTGVEVGDSMQHGGPWPATTDARFTSVGSAAILRFVRPAAWQGFPDALLPPALRDANPLRIHRLVDGVWTA
ncbi:MAG: aldehyde dehydrogenase (NADP(+)) [Candidatus Coatesbacteria bacterium]